MAPSTSAPSRIAGYIVFPLSLPPLPSFPIKATHYLYVSPHSPKTPTSTSSRSLFLVNIPFDTTEIHLKSLFSIQLGLPAGRIEEILFEGQRRKAVASSEPRGPPKAAPNKRKRKRGRENPPPVNIEGAEWPRVWDRDLQTNGRTCVVTFVDRSSMEAALKAVKAASTQDDQPVWGEGVEDKVPSLGSARYLHAHQNRYPDTGVLLESVNNYMTAFNARETAQEHFRARQRQEPDEEGFVTVTRGGRSNPATQKAAQAVAEKHKEKRQELQDFYRFQAREKKKAHANELVKKFEQDREKISRMKERKANFQPE